MFSRRRWGAVLFIYGVCNIKEEEIKQQEEEPRQRNALKLWRMTRSVLIFMHSFFKEPSLVTYSLHLHCNLMANVSRKLLRLVVQLLNQRAGSPACQFILSVLVSNWVMVLIIKDLCLLFIVFFGFNAQFGNAKKTNGPSAQAK